MKKSLLLLTPIALLMSVSAFARHITPEEALNRISSERLTRSTDTFRSAESSVIGNLYIFSNEDGYVILPSDDRAPALLGYSDATEFNHEINPQLRYWLDFYNSELEAFLKTPEASSTPKSAMVRAERSAIAPLIKTKWNQEAPYNELCPKVNGHETVTGCVATAMAQVLKYFSYPTQGVGEHSYYWGPGERTLSFNYGDTTFEWDKMTDTYDSKSTEESRLAVANLMLACGISVDMHYDIGDSGASTMTMGSSFIDYFDYDEGLWMPMRDYYGLYEWEDMVYSELAEGRPVLYAGSGTAGGHQFICDGYSSDGFFHFNWGWGGMSDGYFRLTALNPANLGVGGGAGGFNSGQQIALGVKPKAEGSERHYIMYCSGNFTTTQQEISPNQELRVKGGFYNYSLYSFPDDSKIGMKITPEDKRDPRFEVGYGIDGLRPLTGYGEDFIRFPKLEDGEYTITPAFFDGKRWEEVRVSVGAVGSIRAIVKNGIAQLLTSETASVKVIEIDTPEIIYKYREFPLKFTVENDGTEEFLGDVYPVLTDLTSGEVIAKSLYRPVDVEANTSYRITDYIGEFKALKEEEFEPGDYLLVFHDHAGRAISESVKVTVEADPGETKFKVTDFKLDEEQPVTDKENVKFTFTVTCEEGYFTDHLFIYIFPGDGGRDLAGSVSDMMYIPSGEKHYGSIEMNLSQLEDGEYMAILYKGGKECSDELFFRIEAGDSAVQSLPVKDSDREIVIYDLYGRRCAGILTPGIYIINGVKTMIR